MTAYRSADRHPEDRVIAPARRSRDERGLVGSLHAKGALADDAILFVSSTNLTEAALDANMEMGVLLRGGALPVAVARHYEDLIATGVLRPLRDSRRK